MSTINRICRLFNSQLVLKNRILKLNNYENVNANLRNRLFRDVYSNELRNISTSATLFEETPIKMPSLSPTMTAGTIVKWHKKEGDKISAGDVLCEVQTDKAVMAYEFDDDGVLAKILIDESSKEIPVGTLIAVVCGEDDDWKNVKVPEDAKTDSPSDASQKDEQSKSADDSTSSKPSFNSEIHKMSPSARNLVHHYGIDPVNLKSSGPRGTLLKEDVLKFISDNKLAPKDQTSSSESSSSEATSQKGKPSKPVKVVSATYEDIEISSMRSIIAKRLTESKSSTPHAYMTIRCRMDNVIKLRSTLKKQSTSISVNDIIVKASALALKQVPEMNCQWDSDNNSTFLLQDVDISIAVATSFGLITPIIRNANRLTLEEINSISRDLINRAKDRKLQPDEFVGGSFSISNLGMYDIAYFTGVINPPQAAILAVGSTKQDYVGSPDNYELSSKMHVSLSYDARAVDEEVSALFLEKFRSNLEEPSILLNSDGTCYRRLSSLL